MWESRFEFGPGGGEPQRKEKAGMAQGRRSRGKGGLTGAWNFVLRKGKPELGIPEKKVSGVRGLGRQLQPEVMGEGKKDAMGGKTIRALRGGGTAPSEGVFLRKGGNATGGGNGGGKRGGPAR